MNNQNLFKALLFLQTVGLLIYTVLAFKNEGANLFKPLLENIKALNWSGQFNLDFSSYLILSGLWVMWRNKFSPKSILTAIIAMIVGIMVFAPYLLYLVIKENGDIKKVLIGER